MVTDISIRPRDLTLFVLCGNYPKISLDTLIQICEISAGARGSYFQLWFLHSTKYKSSRSAGLWNRFLFWLRRWHKWKQAQADAAETGRWVGLRWVKGVVFTPNCKEWNEWNSSGKWVPEGLALGISGSICSVKGLQIWRTYSVGMWRGILLVKYYCW